MFKEKHFVKGPTVDCAGSAGPGRTRLSQLYSSKREAVGDVERNLEKVRHPA